MKKHLLIVLALLLALLAGCAAQPAAEPVTAGDTWLLSAEELEEMEVVILNSGLDRLREQWTVPDAEVKKELAELCAGMELFRPTITALDVPTGGSSGAGGLDYSWAQCIFKKGELSFSVAFYDTAKQLDTDYIHRDAPLVMVGKSTDGLNGESWYCTMSPVEYTRLLKLLCEYRGGELVKRTF